MAAPLITVLFFCLISAAEDLQTHQITADPGDDVTLPCRAPNVTIATVEWIRSDADRFVYLKRGRHLVTAYQDPSYVNRVQLKDDEMKNGELSLILKKVTNNDNGTYECSYLEERGRWKRCFLRFELISIVYLKVEGGDSRDGKHSESGKDTDGDSESGKDTDGDSESGKDTDGDSESGKDMRGHLGVILPVPLIAVGLAVGLVISKKRKGRSENKSDLPVVDPDVL